MPEREVKFRYVFKNVRDGTIRKAIHTLDSIEQSDRSLVQPWGIEILLSRDECAGVYDEHGDELYEHDIVQRELHFLRPKKSTIIVRFEVIFLNGQFQQRRLGGHHAGETDIWWEWNELERCGNIWTCPDLKSEE